MAPYPLVCWIVLRIEFEFLELKCSSKRMDLGAFAWRIASLNCLDEVVWPAL
jgi:hypothetical protein